MSHLKERFKREQRSVVRLESELGDKVLEANLRKSPEGEVEFY